MNESDNQVNVTKLEDAVEDVLVENNLQAVLYFSKIQKNWSVLVGEPLAVKTSPQKLEKKTLIVAVEDAAYSHHLKYYEQQLLDLIASPEICGEGAVKRVRFRVGEPSPMASAELEKATAKPEFDRSKPVDLSETARDTSECIEDRKLKNSFARYMSISTTERIDGEK